MKKVIFEDTTMRDTQRQMNGSTARQDSKGDTAPLPRKVGDLLASNKRDDNSLAPALKPYPLNFADEILSDIFVATANLRKIVGNAVENPALKKKFHGNMNYVDRRIEFINRAIVDISRELDKIT
jgi:hypothetical protein